MFMVKCSPMLNHKVGTMNLINLVVWWLVNG